MHDALKIGLLAVYVCALAACGGGREVEVKGEAVGAGGAALSGPIRLEFYEIDDDGQVGDSVDALSLDGAGAFATKVKLEGESVRVLAVADANGDEACSEGELWGEANADIADDDTLAAPIKVELKAAPCP
ncbi:MAG TPA: hypothetical protein VFS43_35180 [Polyangiaceae bacterium]|nr:hypothetical protein [Polyangiaceae bacterium]